MPAAVLRTLATCCQVRLFPEAVGTAGAPALLLMAKASTRRPAPGANAVVAKVAAGVRFEPAVNL